MSSSVFSELFYLEHESGDKVYPARMKNKDTGKISFRVSPGGTGGNTKEAGMEVDDENEMKRLVISDGYAVRAATKDKKRQGLYKIGTRSIIRVVEQQ